MFKPIEVLVLPTLILKDEFLKPVGKAIVACLLEMSCTAYPKPPTKTSTSLEGFMYRMTLCSVLFLSSSICEANPVCAAACSKDVRQATSYVGPEVKHTATINGDNIMRKGYHNGIT